MAAVTDTFVLATVHQQRQNLLRNNRRPVAVYLGFEEMDALRSSVRHSLRITHMYSEDDTSNYIEDLRIYQVISDNHIKVTD